MIVIMIGIALLCLTVKGYCGKKTSVFVQDTSDAFLFNLLRMLFCIFIGMAMVLADGAQGSLRIEGKMLAICILSGVANAAFLAGWILAVRKNSMVSMDVGLTLGSLLPALLCVWLFSEAISLPKMIGFAIIIVATVVLAGHNKATAGGGVPGVLLLVFSAVGEGMSGFAQQLYKQYYTEAGTMTQGVIYPKTVFHFYTYVFAAVVLLSVLIGARLFGKKSVGADGKRTGVFRSVTPKLLLHIFVMAVCLFAANYFQTVATNDYGMSSQMLYPIIKGGCLITVNVTAMLFFGEKMTARSVCGSLLALGGIVCMSVL